MNDIGNHECGSESGSGCGDGACGGGGSDAVRPPRLPGTVVVRDGAEDVYDALGADLLMHARACVRNFGDFHLALSGGSTPFPFYRGLMIDMAYREMPWARTHVWIVDERCVGFEDERSNFRTIEEIFVPHAGIPAEQVHPIRATLPDAAEAYERELRESLEWREKGQDRLDFVLLGMGDDGHTASLFPRSVALDAGRDRLVVANDGPGVTPPARVTMTYHLINSARFVAVLVLGAKKRAMIEKVASGTACAADVPILGVNPTGGELRWYLDRDACPR